MCDNFFDDFDSDYDDGFDEDDFGEHETDGTATEKDDGLWDGPDWEDWMIIGPMSEDIAHERRESCSLMQKCREDFLLRSGINTGLNWG